MSSHRKALLSHYDDVFLLDGVRTPFVEYNTALGLVSRPHLGIKVAKATMALVVGTESMSRNPIAAYTHRGGFRMGEVEFKDFLWEALLDPCPNETMGGTAEKLAKEYGITRGDV